MTKIRLRLLARERIEAIFPQVLWRHLLQRAALHPFLLLAVLGALQG